MKNEKLKMEKVPKVPKVKSLKIIFLYGIVKY